MNTIAESISVGKSLAEISYSFINGHSSKEIEQFKNLQVNFPAQYKSVFFDQNAPKTVVIIPSLTLDQQILTKIKGQVFIQHNP